MPNIQHDARFQIRPMGYSDAPRFQLAFEVDKFLYLFLHYLTCLCALLPHCHHRYLFISVIILGSQLGGVYVALFDHSHLISSRA